MYVFAGHVTSDEPIPIDIQRSPLKHPVCDESTYNVNLLLLKLDACCWEFNTVKNIRLIFELI